jgi:hypothetical protein
MKFTEPFKFIFKGKIFPGFVVKVDTDTNVKVQDIDLTDTLPKLNDVKDVLIEEIKDL